MWQRQLPFSPVAAVICSHLCEAECQVVQPENIWQHTTFLSSTLPCALWYPFFLGCPSALNLITVIQASFGASSKTVTLTFRDICVHLTSKQVWGDSHIITTSWSKFSQYSSHFWFHVQTVSVIFFNLSFIYPFRFYLVCFSTLIQRGWWSRTTFTLASETSNIWIS